MSLTAKEPEGNNMELIPPDTYQALICWITDLGTQHSDFYDKDAPKVVITWEIPSVRIDMDGKSMPRLISKTYTTSLHEKANLRKDLEAIRGVPFSDEDLLGFDIRKALGVNCILQDVHATREKKTYANVATVAKLMKGMEKAIPETPTFCYDIEDGFDFPEDMPDWMRDRIKKSLEYKEAMRPESSDYDPENPDEIPF
jgi:hypothetical protein